MTLDVANVLRTNYYNLETIPILGEGKFPPVKNWTKSAPELQWQGLKNNLVNIAFRANENHNPIDCDDPKTARNLLQFLGSLGLHNVPFTETRRGCHFHLKVTNKPDKHKAVLLKSAGEGHICLGQASYVLAPPSQTSDHIYKLHNATPETLAATMPVVDWQDLNGIFRKPSRKESADWQFEPVRFGGDTRYHPRKGIEYLLMANEPTAKGTRSELEYKAIFQSISYGMSFEETQEFFDEYTPGHYMDKPGDMRDIYLQISWSNAMSHCQGKAHNDRAWTALQNLESASIKSKITKKIIAAILKISWQISSHTVALPQITIADHADCNQAQVSRVFTQLQKRGLIKKATNYAIYQQSTYYYINNLISKLYSNKLGSITAV
ncbi:MAG TPA: bifunctional DNA primase/polymerase [Caldisericia bacterium]|nr:bifunctional DNA primase/polymerase [Caldisericia bacterium]